MGADIREMTCAVHEKGRPPDKVAYADESAANLSADVGDALLGICFGRGRRLRGQLKYRCLLTFT